VDIHSITYATESIVRLSIHSPAKRQEISAFKSAIEQLVNALPRWRPYFLRTGNGAEVDLLPERGQRRWVFEIKLSKAPKPSRGFFQLVEDLRPERAFVVAPVDEPYEYRAGVWVVNLPYRFAENG